jgi:hypothetical protein
MSNQEMCHEKRKKRFTPATLPKILIGGAICAIHKKILIYAIVALNQCKAKSALIPGRCGYVPLVDA